VRWCRRVSSICDLHIGDAAGETAHTGVQDVMWISSTVACNSNMVIFRRYWLTFDKLFPVLEFHP
jgi:hypothetical protein